MLFDFDRGPDFTPADRTLTVVRDLTAKDREDARKRLEAFTAQRAGLWMEEQPDERAAYDLFLPFSILASVRLDHRG
jgi:hypothetical protein